MRRIKKTCHECTGPMFGNKYGGAFCSQRCAARWASFNVNDDCNSAAVSWCIWHGWHPAVDDCPECKSAHCDECGHERYCHLTAVDYTVKPGPCQRVDHESDEFVHCECAAFVGYARGDL
jgi:hypothetical protein